MAHSEAVVLGITSVRDTLMPLLSLRTLLGFAVAADRADQIAKKSLVVKFGGVASWTRRRPARSIVAADPELMDPVPPILAARTGGESRIRSVYRGDARPSV